MPDTDNDKREMIVKEIESWRRSRLLPEQYCDFLQNLYLNDWNERPKGLAASAAHRMAEATAKQWILGFGIFALICVVVLHFSAFPPALQIALAGAVTTGFAAWSVRWRDTHAFRALLYMGAGVLFLFVAGAAILHLNGWEEGIGPVVLLGVGASVCIGCGLIIRLPLVHGFGWLALIALYAKLLFLRLSHPSWMETQLCWVPAACLFAWLSWFLQARHKPAGTVFFITGLIVWFMPEIHGVLGGVDPQRIQMGLLGKILLAGIGMYRLRKHWMEWVA